MTKSMPKTNKTKHEKDCPVNKLSCPHNINFPCKDCANYGTFCTCSKTGLSKEAEVCNCENSDVKVYAVSGWKNICAYCGKPFIPQEKEEKEFEECMIKSHKNHKKNSEEYLKKFCSPSPQPPEKKCEHEYQESKTVCMNNFDKVYECKKCDDLGVNILEDSNSSSRVLKLTKELEWEEKFNSEIIPIIENPLYEVHFTEGHEKPKKCTKEDIKIIKDFIRSQIEIARKEEKDNDK